MATVHHDQGDAPLPFLKPKICHFIDLGDTPETGWQRFSAISLIPITGIGQSAMGNDLSMVQAKLLAMVIEFVSYLSTLQGV